MADTASKQVYPYISMTSWLGVRERFKQTLPRTAVDGSYIASTLGGMTESSASANIVRPLKMMKLIADDGKVTELGSRWRDDEEYPAVCQEILESTYPVALLDVAPPPNPDANTVTRWFTNTAKLGAPAAKKIASTYLMLASGVPPQAVPPKQRGTSSGNTKAPSKPSPRSKPEPKTEAPALRDDTGGDSVTGNPTPLQGASVGHTPSLHIDVQIHISADSTDTQIESIFKHMSQYLYGGKPIGDV